MLVVFLQELLHQAHVMHTAVEAFEKLLFIVKKVKQNVLLQFELIFVEAYESLELF